MDQVFVQEMKTRLETMKREIIENLMSESEVFRELVESDDIKDTVDLASTDIDRKTIEAIGSQDLKRLQLIESALVRIKTDRYGICLKTGKQIPLERLEAIPYALYTVEAQEEIDRRKHGRSRVV